MAERPWKFESSRPHHHIGESCKAAFSMSGGHAADVISSALPSCRRERSSVVPRGTTALSIAAAQLQYMANAFKSLARSYRPPPPKSSEPTSRLAAIRPVLRATMIVPSRTTGRSDTTSTAAASTRAEPATAADACVRRTE